MATRRKNLKTPLSSTKSNKIIQKGGAINVDANALMTLLKTNYSASFPDEIKESQILYQNAKYYYSAGEYSGALVSFACASVLLNVIIRRLEREDLDKSEKRSDKIFNETLEKAKNVLNCCLISVEELQTIVRNSTSSKKDDEDNQPKEWEKICVKIQPLVFKRGSSNCIFYDDVIGLQKEKDKLENSFVFPLIYPNLYPKVSKGILIYGPPGTGKTLLVKAAVNQLQERSQDVGVLYFTPSPGDLKGKYVGETEKKIEEWFTCASIKACDAQRDCNGKKFISIIFIDEIDSIARDRSQDSSGLAANSVNTLLQMMDGINSKENVAIIGATNYPWDLDSAILRRFDTQILIGLPEREDMKKLLEFEINRYLDLDMKISTVCDKKKVDVDAGEALNNSNADKCGMLCQYTKPIKNINKPFYKRFKLDFYEDLKKEVGGDLSQVSGIVAMLKEKNFTNSDISRFVKTAARRAGELSVSCNLFYNTSSIGHITENKEDMYMSSLTRIKDEDEAIQTSIEILDSFRKDMENSKIYQISPPEISVVIYNGFYYYNIKCILYKNVDMVFSFPLLKNVFIKGQEVGKILTPEIYKTNILNQTQIIFTQTAKSVASGVASIVENYTPDGLKKFGESAVERVGKFGENVSKFGEDHPNVVTGATSLAIAGLSAMTASTMSDPGNKLINAGIASAGVTAGVTALGGPTKIAKGAVKLANTATAGVVPAVISEVKTQVTPTTLTDIIISFNVNFEETDINTSQNRGVLLFPSQLVNCFYSSLFSLCESKQILNNNPKFSSTNIPEMVNDTLNLNTPIYGLEIETSDKSLFETDIRGKIIDNVSLTSCNFDFFSFSLLSLISNDTTYAKINTYVDNLKTTIGSIEKSLVSVDDYKDTTQYGKIEYKLFKNNNVIKSYSDIENCYIQFKDYKKLIDYYFIYELLFPNIVTGIGEDEYIKIEKNLFNLLFDKQTNLPTYINTISEQNIPGMITQIYVNSALKLVINYSKDDKYTTFSQCMLVKFLENFSDTLFVTDPIFTKIINKNSSGSNTGSSILSPKNVRTSNAITNAVIAKQSGSTNSSILNATCPGGLVVETDPEKTNRLTKIQTKLNTAQNEPLVQADSVLLPQVNNAIGLVVKAITDLDLATTADIVLNTKQKEFDNAERAFNANIADTTLETAKDTAKNELDTAKTSATTTRATADKSDDEATHEYTNLEPRITAVTSSVKTALVGQPNTTDIYTNIFRLILQEKYLVETGYIYYLGQSGQTNNYENDKMNSNISTFDASFSTDFNSVYNPDVSAYNTANNAGLRNITELINLKLYTFYIEQQNLFQKLDVADVNTKEIFLATTFNFNSIYELKKPNLLSSLGNTIKDGYEAFKGVVIEQAKLNAEDQKAVDNAKLMNDLIEHNQLISVLFKEIKAFGFLFNTTDNSKYTVKSDSKDFSEIVWQNIELSFFTKILDNIRDTIIDPSPEAIQLAILSYTGVKFIGGSVEIVQSSGEALKTAATVGEYAATGAASLLAYKNIRDMNANNPEYADKIGTGMGAAGLAAGLNMAAGEKDGLLVSGANILKGVVTGAGELIKKIPVPTLVTTAIKKITPSWITTALGVVSAPAVGYAYLGMIGVSNVYKFLTNKKENITSDYVINNTFIMTLLNIITTVGKFNINFKKNMLIEVQNSINNVIYNTLSGVSHLLSYTDPKAWSSSIVTSIAQYKPQEITRYNKGQKTEKKNIGYSLYNINIPLQAFHYAFLEVKSSYNSQLGLDLIAYNLDKDKFLAEKEKKDKAKK